MYHRIISKTLKIPEDGVVPVGLLACQRDPLLRELSTVVVSVSILKPPEPTKKSKKAVSAPVLPTDKLIAEVVLQDTILFPEGGGQPTDFGLLTTLDGQSWRVLKVARHGGQAVHFIQVDSSHVLEELSPGTKVVASLDVDDFQRRYDHMCMHTSQHLLSALLETRLQLPTLSWTLTSSPSPCYVEIPRGISSEEISAVQNEANKLVREGRKIHVEVEELGGATTGPDSTANGRAVGRGLPNDYTGGVHRVIVIDGVDRNPCCGTHLPTLHNLHIFILPHTEAVARSGTSSTRLYFLTGPRLMTHLASTHSQLTNISSTLSCGFSDAPSRVGKLLEDRRVAQTRADSVEHELADYVAKSIYGEFLSADTFTKHIHRTEDSPNVLGFLSSISSSFVRIVASEEKEWLLVLTSSPLSPTSSSTNVVLLTGSNEIKIKEVGNLLKSQLGMKGGGRGKTLSGRFMGVWKRSHASIIDDIICKN